jgi:hypothetical protein
MRLGEAPISSVAMWKQLQLNQELVTTRKEKWRGKNSCGKEA